MPRRSLSHDWRGPFPNKLPVWIHRAEARGSVLQALALNPMIWEDFEGLWTLGESAGWILRPALLTVQVG